jgi:ABC-type branched-subunit amino acid transport system ATPase component/ABC-type branched-subunit amino acid transport system permease subunit
VSATETLRPPVYRGALPYLKLVGVVLALLAFREYRVVDLAGANRANLVVYYAIIVTGFYYVFGVAGQFAFSQAAFVGIGAYASHWATRDNPLWVGLVVAIVVCAAIAAVLGTMLIRTDHFHFAIATLGFGEITLLVLRNWRGLSGGATGGDILGAKQLELFGYTFDTDYRVFALLLGSLALLYLLGVWFDRSPMRREAIAMRDQPKVAGALGIPVAALRVRIFVLGSAIAGLAGAYFVHWNGFANPDAFGLTLMLAIYLMLVVGGLGSIWGGLIGVVFYVYTPVFISRLEQYREVFYGALLMVVMIVLPNGIVGVGGRLRDLARSVGRTRSRSSAPPPVDIGAVRRLAVDTRERFVAEPAEDAVLVASDIFVTFGGVRAVDGVSLDLRRGEALGLVGPNGSGKSSFLNSLTGLVPATGRLVVDDREIPLGAVRSVWRAGVLRTYQTPRTFQELCCIDNVLIGTRRRQASGFFASWLARPAMLRAERERWAIASAALERVGLGELASEPASRLSYGQQRMLELARVIASEPTIVLLDEPSAGLNAAETETLARHLTTLKHEGLALLVVDHKIDFITSLCERVAVLESGRLLTVGAPADVWADERVESAYLGAR